MAMDSARTADLLIRGAGKIGDLMSFIGYAVKRFWFDNCTQSAASLTYTSLLALVPLMTITVGILSAFPAFEAVRENAQSLIFNSLVPQVGEVVLEHIESFASRAGQLTAVGVIGLVVTSVLLLASIEGAFNAIWRVREARPLLVRLLSFWAILTITPMLFAASVSLTTRLVENPEFRQVVPIWDVFVGWLPLLFQFIGFAVLYRIIPNRLVRTIDAVVGAAVAAVLFELSKTGFALYLTEFPSYQTIYGALATVPIFLVWLYLAWSIVLFGAVVTASLPEWRSGKLFGARTDTMIPGQRLAVSVAVLRELSEAARLGVGIRISTLVHRVPISGAMMEDTLDALRRARFVERTSADAWLLSRDLSTVNLYDMAKAMGMGLRGSAIKLPPALQKSFLRRTTETLAHADRVQQELLGRPITELIDDPQAELPIEPPIRLDQRRREREGEPPGSEDRGPAGGSAG